MCKKTIQIDGLDSCLAEEGVDARFGTYLTHSKQDTRYNASLGFCSVEGSKKIRFLFLFYIIVLLSLLILILKIRIKDTVKVYFCYRHMSLQAKALSRLFYLF